MSASQSYELEACFFGIANDDESAFKYVFECYRKRIYGIALKMLKSEHEAEGIVQEVFLSLWLNRAKLPDIRDPEAYLFTITYNTIYAYLKKTSRNQKLLNDLIDRMAGIQNTTEEILSGRETQKLINEAVQQLPPQQRIVFQLSKQNDLSYEEIARQMHLSKNTVRNHLAEAMKTIRLFLRSTAGLLSLFL